MADWKEILHDKEEQLTDEDLLKYLHENLSEEEKNEVEKKLTGSFESDALDGLQQIKDTAIIQSHVKQLHQKLPLLLRPKKKRLEKKSQNDFQWTILAIVLLLFICILGYFIIRMV
jgi:5-bromo-4-chloroindolyl phosphate hydrolysis protein